MSDINTINFEPLEADTHAFSMAFKQRALLNTAVLGGGVMLFIAGFILSSFAVVWIGLSLAMLRLFYLGAQVRAFKNGVWERFAAVNDWPINTVLDPATLIPLSLQFGHDQAYSPVITAVLGDVDADMFVYQTTTGSGKSQQTFVFTLARVTLPTTLPHVLLLAKGNLWGSLRQEFVNHETLSLEGDFNDYFTLQIEKGQEVNVLEILTPDVMQTLVNLSQKEDVEIMVDGLYFIQSGDARTPEATRKLVQSVAGLSGQILEQIAQTTAPIVDAAASQPNSGSTAVPATQAAV